MENIWMYRSNLFPIDHSYPTMITRAHITLSIRMGMVLSISLNSFAQIDGYVLHNNQNQSTARLLDKTGAIAHSWSCPTNANYAMALKPNGNIVRGAIYSGNQINGAAVGGMVQELDPNANVVWQFIYSTADYVSHHDLCVLPNGNVLLTAWYKQTNAQLQALGYTGTSAKYPTRIIEVQQNGTGGQVVWEWNMLDHFIQDADPGKPNYGVIADHPERMNINVATTGMGGGPFANDWFHVNGIDYNPALDQIAFSSRYLSEVFIIDHSTTTVEAATSTGGNSGMGGDFLYRWGKSSNYNTAGTQTIAGAVHDVRWIKTGAPNAGYLQFVNNVGGPGNSTTIDAISPPLNGYTYTRSLGTAYGPTTYDWRHSCLANSAGQSASDRMPDGNVFVALSDAYMYEVDSLGNTVWQYNDSPQKAFRYLCADPGIEALLGPDPCGLGVGVDEVSISQIEVFPNPTTGMLKISGIPSGEISEMVVRDAVGREVHRNTEMTVIDLSSNTDGFYHLSIALRSGERVTKRIALQR